MKTLKDVANSKAGKELRKRIHNIKTLEDAEKFLETFNKFIYEKIWGIEE